MSSAPAIQTADDQHKPAASGDSSVISLIERAARDPSLDIDRMMRLMEMRDTMLDREARVAFATAFVEMQPKLPVINERGRIEVRDKNNPERVTQSTSFAQWEDINEAVQPILYASGFSLSFRTGSAADGKITVTAVLEHRLGHAKETTLSLPHDSTGSKNAVQAVGSSTSYGKRYTALALLNITSRAKPDRDDDGNSSSASNELSDEQVADLSRLATATQTNLPKFLAIFGVERIEDIPPRRFSEALSILRDRERKQKAGQPEGSR